MPGWEQVRNARGYEVVSRRWDAPNNEVTEMYVFGNGWGVEVVTNLENGVIDASSTVLLLLVADAGACWGASDDEVPPAPDDGGDAVWFTDQGESPDWLTPEGLRDLCAAVGSLPARVDLGGCQWFTMCGRDATHMEKHPAFPGGVPACDECASIGK